MKSNLYDRPAAHSFGVLCSAESTTIGNTGEQLEFDVKYLAIPSPGTGSRREHSGRVPLDM